jgi:hypothetical protein
VSGRDWLLRWVPRTASAAAPAAKSSKSKPASAKGDVAGTAAGGPIWQFVPLKPGLQEQLPDDVHDPWLLQVLLPV